MSKKLLTLCLAQDGSRVLLAMKKRGFGAHRWNGMGGKVEQGETLEQAAIRECKEEVGIDVEKLQRVGLLRFEFQSKPGEVLEVHLFRIEKFAGEPVETDEMKPQWFDVSEIPFDSMWPDDRHWFPLFLAGKFFEGNFLFGEKDVILRQDIEEWHVPKPGERSKVINCAVMYNGKLLLVQRSSSIQFYPNKWNGVSGFFSKPTLKEQIEKEFKEELGLNPDNIISFKEGEPFEYRDDDYDRTWYIYPVRVEINTDRIQLDWEAQQYAWIDPSDLKAFDVLSGFVQVVAAVLR